MTTARQAAVAPWTVGTVWNAVSGALLAVSAPLLARAAPLLAQALPAGLFVLAPHLFGSGSFIGD